MRTRISALTGAVSLAILTTLGCSSSNSTSTLSVTASPQAIAADGVAKTTVTVTAKDSGGKAGSGTVLVSSVVGTFASGTNSETLTLAGGTASTTWSCSAATQASCAGSVAITGLWGNVAGVAQVKLPGSNGTGPGNDDGGITTVITTSSGPITLASSKSKIYMGVGDFSVLTATTFVGSVDSGVPSPNQTVNFVTAIGAFKLADGGLTQTTSLTTDNSGEGTVMFTETGTAGTATIAATNPSNNATATTTVDILRVQQIVYTGTTCQGQADCSLMGVKTSGFHETAQVSFQVLDATNIPVPGVAVTFSLVNAPAGVTLGNSPQITAIDGSVTINVSSGSSIGAFAVKATVIPGSIEATSPTIGVGGAIPTNHGMRLYCDKVNVSAYASNVPPRNEQVACHITLVDRFNNPVGTGTAVYLKSEVGKVPSYVTTQAFDPNHPTDPAQGTATFVFDTNGPFPPLPTTPFGVDATFSYPFLTGRAQEPSSGTFNPRDGLVTIIAYVEGEEYFVDSNSDGVRDNNEAFLDQGEPFIDANDDNVLQSNELFVDVDNSNTWDGPNGAYDSHATVWAQTHILYTDAPSGAGIHFTQPGAFTSCGGVPVGGAADIGNIVGDTRLNRVSSDVSFTVAVVSGNETAKFSNNSTSFTPADSYGFQIAQAEVDGTTGAQCAYTTGEVCLSKLFFGGFGDPTYGAGQIDDIIVPGFSAAQSPSTGCANTTISLEWTLGGVTTGVDFFGFLKNG